MKDQQLNRLINLVRRTGDRIVVLDREINETLVLMRLDEYENLIDLTKERGGDGKIFFAPPGEALEDEEPDKAVFITEHPVNLKMGEGQVRPNSNVSCEISLDDVLHEEEEEKFYLEPVD